MAKEELHKLDNYGHKELKSLTEYQLCEYLSLLVLRRQEVLDRILELRKQTTMIGHSNVTAATLGRLVKKSKVR